MMAAAIAKLAALVTLLAFVGPAACQQGCFVGWNPVANNQVCTRTRTRSIPTPPFDGSNRLRVGYYNTPSNTDSYCPSAESTVRKAVADAIYRNPGVGAKDSKSRGSRTTGSARPHQRQLRATMASNALPVVDDELVHDFSPVLRVYKSGRVERPSMAPPVAPGLDPSTGVESKDVDLGVYSARLYLPPSSAGNFGAKLPVIVYIHGGGFSDESAKSPNYHRFLNNLASACPAIGVSVDYRLAPEHPLPAVYDDCLAALGWVLSAADPWIAAHGDLGRVFVAGDSAGANACHYLAIQPDAAPLKGAVLIHPWFWGSEAVGEERRDPAGRAIGWGLWKFLSPGTSGADDPRMNPMAPDAPGLEGLACERVMVCTAEGDFLRWRGRAYSEAVTAAWGAGGQEVELLETEGEGHVFFLFKPDSDKTKEMLDRIVAFVNAA